MMIKKTLYFSSLINYIFIACLLFTSSCKKTKDDETIQVEEEGHVPGFFTLTALNISSNKNLRSSKNTLSYDLGEIKATDNFDFILTNGGDEPIFDINLTIDDEDIYNITPKNINVLPSNKYINYTNEIGYIPVVSFEVIHGINPSGIGYADLLPIGKKTGVLTISGKTLSGIDTIQVSSTFEFDYTPLIMEFVFYRSGERLTLSDFDTYYFLGNTVADYLDHIIYYAYDSYSMGIENTGNTALEVVMTERYRTSMFTEETLGQSITFSLAPNEIKSLSPFSNHPYYYNYEYYHLDLSVNGFGTAFKSEFLKLQSDGKAYVSINNW